MDMTVRDFIAECEAYPYSKEAINIDQQIASLIMLEQYIESAKYFHGHEIRSEFISENVEFFNADLNVAYAEAVNKANSIKDSLGKRLKSMVSRMAAFLIRLVAKHDQITPKAKACVKILSQRELSTVDINRISNILKKGDGQRDLYAPFKKQPFGARFHIIYMENKPGVDAGTVNAYLAAVLSNSVVAANVGFIHISPPINGSTIGVVPFETLVDACTKLMSQNGGPAAAAGALISGWAKTKQEGLIFKTDSGSIKKDIRTLESLTDKVNEFMTSRVAQAEMNDGAIAAGGQAALAAVIQKVLIATLGATMRVYSGYLAYRTYVVLNLYEYLQSLQ